jgi:hypothetical protein
MERTRTTLFLLFVGLALMTAGNPVMAAAAAQAQTPTVTAAEPSTPAVTTSQPDAAAAVTAATDTPKCPAGCSPLAGAWVAKLSSPVETVIQTIKFVPINNECSTFAVNSQASTRSAKVIKFWPDATDLTEFVGTACASTWNDVRFTAIGYGVQRCDTVDKVVFIEVLNGRIEVPEGCGPCSGQDAAGATLPQTDELKVTIYASYFDADQDVDRDGFPDKCEPVICMCFETKLKRVNLMEPCEESKSFVACLEKCKDCNTPATGRAFITVHEKAQEICFVLTVKNLKDATKAAIQVNGVDVVTLFPFPPETKGKDGDCDGLLSCGCFYVKDCIGTWKGKKFADIVKAIEEGQATVVVSTKKFPKGEICGKVMDP